ncbi:MAG: polyprenyl synthetase family protein [Epsilonproteobacteria bacterium]|nr:polyprenyl synthetase family protein [Campylobacterota bacterium]
MKTTTKNRSEKLNLFIKDRIAAVPQNKLKEAMQYVILQGGKRLRPQLCWETASLFDADEEEIVPVAAAIEYIHTYSLIHDDLPSMDDDDTRRGIPSLHKKFGEATAILTGDAFLTDAFYILANSRIDAGVLKNIVLTIAAAAGSGGMVEGQISDVLINKYDIGEEQLIKIALKKTGELIKASVLSGALIGRIDKIKLGLLNRYGGAVGLAYQISDDIKDIKKDRLNIASFMGKKRAIGRTEELLEKAEDCLRKLKIENGFLIRFTELIRNRLEE